MGAVVREGVPRQAPAAGGKEGRNGQKSTVTGTPDLDSISSCLGEHNDVINGREERGQVDSRHVRKPLEEVLGMRTER
jgi:hypothetical protein